MKSKLIYLLLLAVFNTVANNHKTLLSVRCQKDGRCLEPGVSFSASDLARQNRLPSELSFGAVGFSTAWANMLARSDNSNPRIVNTLDTIMIGTLLVAAARDLQKKSGRYDTVAFVAGAVAGAGAIPAITVLGEATTGIGFCAGTLGGVIVDTTAQAFGSRNTNFTDLGAVCGIATGAIVGAVTGITINTGLMVGSTLIVAKTVQELTKPGQEDEN